jgi:hypothetical protein
VTVVAFKDGVMAADTQETWGNARVRVSKLIRLPCGGVAGAAGDGAASQAAMNWLASDGPLDGQSDRTLPDIRGAEVLVAKSDGTLWLLYDRFPGYPLLDECVAIGCGSDAARMAMSYGASAVEACQRVAKQDVFCGDPVQSMEVQPTHEYPDAVTHKRSARK